MNCSKCKIQETVYESEAYSREVYLSSDTPEEIVRKTSYRVKTYCGCSLGEYDFDSEEKALKFIGERKIE